MSLERDPDILPGELPGFKERLQKKGRLRVLEGIFDQLEFLDKNAIGPSGKLEQNDLGTAEIADSRARGRRPFRKPGPERRTKKSRRAAKDILDG
jgi:hypothetical protein